MRKIIAAVFIFLSVITYSQWSNTFSKENEEVMTSNPKDVDPEPGQAVAVDPSGEIRTSVCPDGSDQSLDCDCDGTLDSAELNPDEICGSPNPADPVPVDDYIPLLLIIAAGLITYKTYGRKSLS